MSESVSENLSHHVPRMYRVALRVVGDSDRAQDVVQNACLKALRGMTGFHGRSTLASWLHRITLNCAVDHLRTRQRSMSGRAEMSLELAGIPACSDATPAMKAERREMYELALGLVKRLPDDCRNAFILTQLDGYSYDETAAIEGQPRGTIASRVYRAKRILLEQMSGQADERIEP